MKKNLLLCVVFSTFLCMCTSEKKWEDPSSHSISLVTVDSSVQLEILDWGGKGEPLLFLAGLGNTAHVFDDFAPQFTDHFHVLALTRRGFGSSSKPPTGYDPATMAKDILTVIDSLHIERITLIGHSIAGEEMTKFAALYPNRVNKLVYIDAASDRTAPIDTNLINKMPPPPAITTKDSASVKNGQAYLYRILGVTICEAELRASSIFDKAGRYAGDLTPEFVIPAIMNSMERPAYKQIQALSLAFFNVADSARDNFPFYETLDSSQRAAVQECFDVEGKQYLRNQIDLFKKEVTNGEVVEIHRGNHYLFISNEVEVAKEIRKFLERK